jgi:hypothetical protein
VRERGLLLPKPSLIPESRLQFAELFRSLGRVEQVFAAATILHPDDNVVATDVVFLEAGDALQWRDRKMMDRSAQLATLKTAGTVIGASEVVVGSPRRFEARMLTDGRIVRLSAADLMRLRASRPDVWEMILLKALEGQTNVVNDTLFL